MAFKNNLKNMLKILFFSATSLITFSSLINIYNNKSLIKNFVKQDIENYTKLSGTKKDQIWAKKVIKGGYILHFRHAERDKWIDVQMYDALESDVHKNGINNTRFAEKDYFKNAVCLNKRGLIQAKAIGEHLKQIDFPIGFVASSPSCRSRQTAELAFGGFNLLNRDLVHEGPYIENKEVRNKRLTNFYLNLPLKKDENTIVSSHNSVIRADILTNSKDNNLSLEEGGFYVLSKTNGGLFLEHEFHSFNSFIRQFYIR